MTTVESIVELFVDDSQLVRLYSLEGEANVYEGEACDIPDDLMSCDVWSIDSVYSGIFDGYITLNID